MKKLSKSFRPLALAVLGVALVSCEVVTPTFIVSGDENTVTIRPRLGMLSYDFNGAKRIAEQHCAKYNKLAQWKFGNDELIDYAGGFSNYLQRTYSCLEEGQIGLTGPLVFQAASGRHVGYQNAAGQWEGEGIYTITAPGPNFSDRFVGNFSNGKRQGQGRYTFFGGRTQNGLWLNDEFIEENDKPSIVSTEIEEMDRQARDLRLRRLREETSEEQRVVNQQAAERQVLQNQCKAFGFIDDTPEMANCLLELYKIENQPQQNTVIANPAPVGNSAPNPAAGIELMNRGLQILNGVGTPSTPTTTTSRCRRMGDTSGQVYTFSRIGCPVGYAPAL